MQPPYVSTERLIETAENLADRLGEEVSDLARTLETIARQVVKTEQENAALRSALDDASTLLRRGRALADEIDLDVGWQYEVDLFLAARGEVSEGVRVDE